MKLQATFKGKNGTAGYVETATYILEYQQSSSTGMVTIKRMRDDGSVDEKTRVQYFSAVTFFDNWRNVSKLP